jgi:hypothetical protein
MPIRLDEILTHDNTEECVACRSRDFTAEIIVPAVAAWEASEELPRLSLALHGAAGLLGVMLADGVPRDQIDDALSRLLDEIEADVAEEGPLSGPTQGTA